jgi:hypothetical protein
MVWSLTRTLTLASALGCLSFSGSASAEEAVPGAWLDSQVNERGQRCDRRAEHRLERSVLVACAAAGVWEVALGESGPRFVRSLELGGDAVGFFAEGGGQLWVKLQVLQAKPLSAATPVAPAPAGAAHFTDPSPASLPSLVDSSARPELPAQAGRAREPASPPAPAARTKGQVLSTFPGGVVISLGSDDGLARGDRIELAVEADDGTVGGDGAVPREAIAVGVVTSLNERQARVRLGLNESVPLGAVVTRTRSPATASLAAPPRVGALWHLEAMGRPFAALGELGGGILLSGAFGRRFASGLHVWGVIDPLGVADVDVRDSISVVNGAVFATYDSQYFEMGLGLGGQTVNETGLALEPGSGLSVAQYIRLGAVDGLNIAVRTSVVLFHSEFAFGGMVGTAQIPVTRGYWLQFGGGGGDLGYGYGEIGLRALLRGNGGAGSTFLSVSAGGAAVFRSGTCPQFEPCSENVSYGGPMGGLGGEWRF